MADYTYKLTKGKEGEISVEAVAQKSRYEKAEEAALQKLAPTIKVDGFRPGKAPKSAILARLGSQLVEEALNLLLPGVAVEIIATEKLNPVSQLDYKVTDIDKDGNVKFTFEFANYPEVKLGDYRKIKAKKEEVKVEDKDINEVLIRLFRDPFQKANPDKKETKDEEILAWITDEQVKEQMGKEYDGLEKLKGDIKKQLERSKEQEVQDKYEQSILDQAISLSQLTLPHALIHAEVDRKEHSYRNRVKQLDIDFDVFLTAQNTTLEELHKNWHEAAEKEIKTDLILAEISSQHKLVPQAADIDSEIDKVTDQKMRLELKSEDGRRYVASMLMRQRGFAKLMELSGADVKTDKSN